MYYLLENGKIIESRTKFSHILHYENRKGLLYKVFEDKNYGKNRKIGKIKKQSENVFDLVDKEKDLIEVGGQIIMAKHISGDISKMSGIFAIYKPDEKGNYIKVWEKKEGTNK